MRVALSPDSFEPTRLADAIFHETNAVRRRLGLHPFQRLTKLDQAADLQAGSNALDMSASHFNIIPAWATPALRVTSVGLKPTAVSENVAVLPLMNVDPSHGYIERIVDDKPLIIDGVTGETVQPHTYASFAQAILRSWMNSPGHRANIVNPNFRYIGCSARPTRSVAGQDMIAGVQVFITITP